MFGKKKPAPQVELKARLPSQENAVVVPMYRTVRIQDVDDFYPQNLNPTFQRSRKELARSEILSSINKGIFTKEFIIILAVLLLFGAIAYVIVVNGGVQAAAKSLESTGGGIISNPLVQLPGSTPPPSTPVAVS